MKIKLDEKEPQCPKCKIALNFEKARDIKITEEHGHKRFISQTDLYRCQKCLNLYVVKE